MELVVFMVLAAVAVAAAVATIAWSSPLRSAFSLLVCLFSLAAVYVTLYAHFLAVMQILVYAGSVMVLFIFVIMLLDLRTVSGQARITVLSLLSGFVLLVIAGKFARVIISAPPGADMADRGTGADFGTIGAVADVLFKQFMTPFELTSLLLLVAVVGAVVVARRRFWREER